MHHAGGWTVGNLDEFEGAMRIIAEESGHQVRHAAFFNAFDSVKLTHVTPPSSRVFDLCCTQSAWEQQCMLNQMQNQAGCCHQVQLVWICMSSSCFASICITMPLSSGTAALLLV